ncbi:MAG: hybrid sensor histidine kinase/response regulator [Actinobacteria bacterium]|nr:hybrid sensor histidine kinase/response regulator [Actinomycetota bacterium]
MLNPSEFLDKFKEEALERLQRMNEGYIQLESGLANRETINDLLREAHTLKGSARMVGMNVISDLAHKLEDLLIAIKEDRLRPSDNVSEVIFQILDLMFEIAESGSEDQEMAVVLEEKANKVMKETTFASSTSANDEENDQKKEKHKEKIESVEEETLKVHEMSTIRVKASQIDEQLNLVGESVIVANQLLSSIPQLKGFIRKCKLISDSWDYLKELVSLAQNADRYTKEMFRSFSEAIDGLNKESNVLISLLEVFSKLELILSELHQKSMEMRMLPASYIFNLFPRAVRDMSKDFAKKIDLIIEGEDTLIDKRVLEEIYDPLIHILRNAVDHGIEMPEERLAYGKPETGTIKISAKQEGDRIIVKVSDDGRGIDPELIRKVALRKGLISEAEAESISDKEAIYLIFKPGFSSKAETTETSGRGIGMDVVKLHIEERLKGHIEIETEKGKGTSFILTLPLTLAVVRCLLVRTAGMLFAVPTANVQETLIFDDKDIVIVGGERQLKLRDSYLPFIKLSNVFGISGIYEGKLALIVEMSGRRIAYEVEEIIDEIPVVIKPIDEVINESKLFAGATILGSGDIVLILNIGELVRSTTSKGVLFKQDSTKKKIGSRKPRILVVEDSLTTRELEVSLLKAAGYEAVGVRDGYEALSMLKSKKFDLVLTDIQMPRMDGYELIKKVKKDETLRNIPMVVVSSKSSEKEIELGLKAGADAYITKNEFEKENILSIISRLVNVN